MAIRFKEFKNKLENDKNSSNAQLIEHQLHDIIKEDDIRREFYAGDKFNVGKRVIFNESLYEIIDKRSNYVLLCDANSATIKAFPESLTPTDECVKYKENTFKGMNIPKHCIQLIESLDKSDAVLIMRLIESFTTYDFKRASLLAEKTSDKQGVQRIIRSEKQKVINKLMEQLNVSSIEDLELRLYMSERTELITKITTLLESMDITLS